MAGTLITAILWMTTTTEANNINAWIKPFKFFLSTTIVLWSLAWYLGYLPEYKAVQGLVWVTVGVFVFELVYINIKVG